MPLSLIEKTIDSGFYFIIYSLSWSIFLNNPLKYTYTIVMIKVISVS